MLLSDRPHGTFLRGSSVQLRRVESQLDIALGQRKSYYPKQCFEFPVGRLQNACYPSLLSKPLLHPCTFDLPLLSEGIPIGVIITGGTTEWILHVQIQEPL